ncbi:MAG: enoyl-CoA hydratase-related protein [bacterium]
MALIKEKKEGILYLTLNRPEVHNSLDPETVVELANVWEEFRGDNDVRVAIITGAGDKSFCSGADLARLIPLISGARKPETDADHAILKDPTYRQRALLRDFELYKPVIAAINGHAIAGGMELVQATDIRIAAENATFGLQEVKWGLFPMGGSTVRLPRQIPFAYAMEILLTGERISADEAHRLGFVNRVVPREKVLEEAEKIAAKIAENGPISIKAIKESVIKNIGVPIKDGMMKEIEIGAPVFFTEDAKEGPRAFKEKRKPNFVGR